MSKTAAYQQREITVYNNGALENTQDAVVEEKPITVFVNHIELATMICTPGAYEELGVGFLLSEGLLNDRDDIVDISCREDEGLLYIETKQPLTQTHTFLRRHIASCCGKSRAGFYFINDARQVKPIEAKAQFKAEDLLAAIKQLEERSETFQLTGGVHSAALADGPTLLSMYEDIGRHNAVDKVIGSAFLNRLNTNDKCLLLSGRVASEILIKAARAGIPLILSRSAPTGLTIDLAEDLNITVVGFARDQRLSIYTHPERVLIPGGNTSMGRDEQQIIAEIKRLKEEKKVYIIAHYYQRPEVQDIADFVGDSYAMAVAAQNSPCDTILVAGVDFMAESAAILCPDKTVLSPEPRATCPMANSIEVSDVLKFKQEHPEGLVVSYVNTPADIKAVTDICVTSSNAVKIINKLPREARIFFIPDTNLGTFVAGQLDRELDLFPSHCPTHAHITKADILQRKAEHPEAAVLVHPECDPEVVALADYAGSTAGIIDYATKTDKDTLIIGTECGVFHKIQQLNPDKELVLAQEDLVCPNMKSVNLKKILRSLETMETKITVPEAIREKAALSLEKMIEYAS